MNQLNVLISGVGEGIGFGIGRIFKRWSIFNEIHGIDITEDHAGTLLFDHVSVAPRADSHKYKGWIKDYVRRHKIDIFVPTSEAEILTIAREISFFQSFTKVLINDLNVVELCLDKHSTLEFLAGKGVLVPEHGLVKVHVPTSYPIVVKPRRGQGSKGIRIVFTEENYGSLEEGQVWQTLLVPEDEEYTCAIYVDPQKNIRTLQIKRRLMGGLTGKGLVVRNTVISRYLKEIVDSLDFCGCINIQLRLTDKGPLIFEINPRLSNTLVFRDIMGFTDLRWWVSDLLGFDKATYKAPMEGTRIYRGNMEYIIRPD